MHSVFRATARATQPTLRAGVWVLSAMFLCACATEPRDRVVAFEPDPNIPFDRCVSVGGIESTDVLDDQNILFRMRGGQTYRNFLPRRCPGLTRGAFSYRARGSQLCSVDVITVLENVGLGPRQGATCSLGGFYPVTPAEVDAIKLEIERIRELGLN